MHVATAINRHDRKDVPDIRTGWSLINLRHRPIRTAVGGFQHPKLCAGMAIQFLWPKCGVEISVVGIDNEIALATGRYRAGCWKCRYLLRKSFAAVSGFSDEDNVGSVRACGQNLPITHVYGLWSVSRNPLAIIRWNRGRYRIHFPFLAGFDAAHAAVVRRRHRHAAE